MIVKLNFTSKIVGVRGIDEPDKYFSANNVDCDQLVFYLLLSLVDIKKYLKSIP